MKKQKATEQSSEIQTLRKFIRTSLTYHLGDFPGDFNHVDSKSETVPDQAMLPSELVKRYYSGMSFAGQLPQYSEDMVVPDLSKMDLVEIDLYREKLAEDRKRMEESLKYASQVQAQKADEERQKKEAELLAKLKNSLASPPSPPSPSAS